MSQYEQFHNEPRSGDNGSFSHHEDMPNGSQSTIVTINPVSIPSNQISEENLIGNDSSFQNKVRRIVEHLAVRVFFVVLLLVDICILIVEVNLKDSFSSYEIVSMTFITLFMIETLLRIYALKPKIFFQEWYNILDFLIILISFIINILTLTSLGVSAYARFLIIGRLIRLIALARLYTQHINLKKGARQFVSQNKRRYQMDGFDLDLTYVTDRVIAMSFPSSGRMSLYRNSIKEVSRFLEHKHKDHYKVYNLCLEKSYDISYFKNRVERFMIEDHNVPFVSDMIKFVKDVQQWLKMDPKNVIAVHCKGGKGRTGTMICIWLIEAGLFGSAEASLSYFGTRRTDLSVGQKFQGVETPSQSRYVEYFTAIKEKFNGIPPANIPVKIKLIKIFASSCLGKFNGEDMKCEIYAARDRVMVCDFALNRNCEVNYIKGSDTLEIKVINSPVVAGDVRLRFISTLKAIPIGYDSCPFYFWFHTSFLSDNKIYIHRNDLDNPHKPKTWTVYSEQFGIEVTVEPVNS